MPRLPYYVIIQGANGGPEQFPLKRWVRHNLNHLPQGFISTGSTYQLRNRLARAGWEINITENAGYVVQPDIKGQFQYAEVFVNNIEEIDEDEVAETEAAYEVTFSLERDLQKAIRQNIAALEEGLEIVDSGKERNTIAGRIDITAKDRENKTVIIELKAVEAKPDVLAQVLAYMEAVQQEDNSEVRGIIIASGFTERVRLAAKQVRQLKLVTYTFQFNFNIVR